MGEKPWRKWEYIKSRNGRRCKWQNGFPFKTNNHNSIQSRGQAASRLVGGQSVHATKRHGASCWALQCHARLVVGFSMPWCVMLSHDMGCMLQNGKARHFELHHALPGWLPYFTTHTHRVIHHVKPRHVVHMWSAMVHQIELVYAIPYHATLHQYSMGRHAIVLLFTSCYHFITQRQHSTEESNSIGDWLSVTSLVDEE